MTQEQEHEILFNEYYDLKRINYRTLKHVRSEYLTMLNEVYEILDKLGLINKYEKWEARMKNVMRIELAKMLVEKSTRNTNWEGATKYYPFYFSELELIMLIDESQLTEMEIKEAIRENPVINEVFYTHEISNEEYCEVILHYALKNVTLLSYLNRDFAKDLRYYNTFGTIKLPHKGEDEDD